MKKITSTVFAIALVVVFTIGALAVENDAVKDRAFVVNPFPTTKYWKGDFSAYPKADWQFKKQARINGAGDVSSEGRSVLEAARKATNSKYDYNVFLTMSQMDEIAVSYGAFLGALLQKNSFGIQDTERMILRAGWRMGSLYEYSHHVKIGLHAGLTMDEIETLSMENSATWTDKTRAIMYAVDDLVAKNDITDEHWKELKKYYTDKQMIKFIFLIGHYKMVAQLINTVGIPVEDPFFIGK